LDFDLKLARSVVEEFPQDLRDHSYNVCNIAVELAKYAGCGAEQVRILATGALIHDIGKCCISKDILNKPGRLTEDEFNQVKQHTILGIKMIKQFKESHKYEPIILYHHERWDGRGYFGLLKHEIPELARIVTIADAFDAMTSFRPYQNPKTLTGALEELNVNKGTQFEPGLVKMFEDYILNLLKAKQSTKYQ